MVLYKKIADDIRIKIIQGDFDSQVPMPNQQALAKEYNTSRVTIQKAIDILKNEGIIYSKRGAGTFVRQNASTLSVLDNRIDVYEGFTKMFSSKEKISSKILNFSVRFPNKIEIEKLMLTKTSPVYDILRLRYLNDDPATLEHTIMPIETIPNIDEVVLNKSIYGYIKDELKLTIGLANRRVHADKPSEIDKKYLECSQNDPVLEVEQVVFLDTGIPFEYSKTRRRYDKGDIVMIQMSKN